MELFKDLVLLETQRQAHREILYSIRAINDTYNEWKKRPKNRRKNAVNLITTSVNKITTIPPESIDYVNDDIKQRLAIIIMRCLSLPSWRDVNSKKSAYRKLYPYIAKLELVNPNTGTGGTLREIIMTRFSVGTKGQSDYPEVFVAYEPVLPKEYLNYLFNDSTHPTKTFKMQALALPPDFDDLLQLLKINHEKAVDLYLKSKRK